ncbi:MAG: type II toxin-antitoxin system VapC family toxin [Betaproteobacteria bacterium]|nr:type II toxin-antitoxin system VapC family toxin [Betaproteobacteria bacterium]
MIVLDTHVLIYDALAPERLTSAARAALDEAEASGSLACADITLWEVAMLVAKGRLNPGGEVDLFLRDAVDARGVRVLPITPEIAVRAQSAEFAHGDPADRLIAATALVHRASLMSADGKLAAVPGLRVIW